MSDIPINPVTRRVQFTGNTGLGPFAFTFNIYVASDIAVYRNAVLLTLTTDYTVTIAANGTGSVTLTGSGSGTTLTLNDSLTIVGARQLARTTDFVTAGDLLAVSLNEQLDSNVIMSQQLDEKIDRSIKFDQFDTYTTATLPAAADRADKIIKFDVDGELGVASAADFFGNAVLGANYVTNTATGTGSQVAFGLTVSPGSKNNIQVYIDGVYQNKASFSISAATITFSEAPPLNSAIEFIIGQAITEISGDSDSINYTQGGTGSQQRTLTSKLQESVSVKDFGATGDGVADDTAAIQAALDVAVASGKTLFVPSGSYKCSARIEVTSTSGQTCQITGENQYEAELFWTDTATNGGGISITYQDLQRPPVVSDLSLFTQALGTGTALLITGPEAASSIYNGPIVIRLSVRGKDIESDCWDVNIHFYTAWYIKLDSVIINGLNEYGPVFNSSVGIKLTSCQVCYMTSFNIFHVDIAIEEAASGVASHGEGFSFSNFELVGVNRGINLAADGVAPGTNIGPGHINAFQFGVNLANQYQTTIHDLLIYKTTDAVGSPLSFVGISLADCFINRIHNNFIHGFTSAHLVGIQLSGSTTSDFNMVHHNQIYYFSLSSGNKIGIVVGTGAGKNIFDTNFCDDSVDAPYQINVDADAQNYFFNNIPALDETFTANNATPSVGNGTSNFFVTANASATTITNFTNGYLGQEIRILANDANTTIQHNAGLILRGGANYVMSNGDILSLHRQGSLWREFARST